MWRGAVNTRIAVTLVVVAYLAIGGCSSSTAPSASGVAGTWTGTLLQPGGLTGTFDYSMQLTQNGTAVSGTTHIDIPAQTQSFAEFAVSGTFDSATNVLQFQELHITNQGQAAPGAWCTKSGTLQLSVSPRRLSGPWTAPGCLPGTITLNGQ